MRTIKFFTQEDLDNGIDKRFDLNTSYKTHPKNKNVLVSEKGFVSYFTNEQLESESIGNE